MSANKAFQLLEKFTCHGFYTIQGRRQLLKTGGTYPVKNIPSCRSNTAGGLGHCKPPSGSRVEPLGSPGGKAPEALKSLHSTLPEIVKNPLF